VKLTRRDFFGFTVGADVIRIDMVSEFHAVSVYDWS
jgi:hypothetical protein